MSVFACFWGGEASPLISPWFAHYLSMPSRLWYVPTAQCLHVMRGHTAAVNAVAMTTDGSKTISGSSDGSTKVWNTDIASR